MTPRTGTSPSPTRSPPQYTIFVSLLAMLGILVAGDPRPAVAAGARQLAVAPEVAVTANHASLPEAYNSPVLAVDPTDSRFVVLANRLDAPGPGCALHLSGDGGRGWVPAAPVAAMPAGTKRCYAPQVAFDGHGLLYFVFAGLAGEDGGSSGVFLMTSADRGRTFSAPRRLLGPGGVDARVAIDPAVGIGGRLHVVWLQVGAAPAGDPSAPHDSVLVAYSDDGGRTLSAPVRVGRSGRSVVAPALALGPRHAVYLAYWDRGLVRRGGGDPQAAAQQTWSVVVASSIDAGVHFGPATVVDADVVAVEAAGRVSSVAAPALAAGGPGQLVAAWADARDGDVDVLVRRSGDGGAHWSGARRLSGDRAASGGDQYLPHLSVARDGRLDAVFYDRRRDPANVLTDVSYAYSSDGGRSFAAATRLTARGSDARIGPRRPGPAGAGTVGFGTELALVSEGPRVVAAWTDTRNTALPPGQDIFATEVRFPAPGGGSGGMHAVGTAVVLIAAGGVAAGARRRRARALQVVAA